jgi:hypothetical protein
MGWRVLTSVLATFATFATVAIVATPAHAAVYRVVTYSWEVQGNPYYCGPAATRLALTSQTGSTGWTQSALAGWSYLQTEAYKQTPHIGLVVNTLNAIGTGRTYAQRNIPSGYSSYDREQLRWAVKHTIGTQLRVLVANVKGGTYDTSGRYHSYPDGHYLTVVGYNADNNAGTVVIEDVASSASHRYEMSIDNLTYWIASKGYAYTL